MDRRDNEFGEERAAVEAARPTPKVSSLSHPQAQC